MRCPICTFPIEADQPTVEIPELAGGGVAHKACSEQLAPWIDRFVKELDAKENGDGEAR